MLPTPLRLRGNLAATVRSLIYPMKSIILYGALAGVLSTGVCSPALAQLVPTPSVADTTHRQVTAPVPTIKPAWYRGRVVQATLVPAVLIGYGLYTFNGHGFYTNQQADRDIHRLFPANHTHAENVLQYISYAELGVAALAGATTQHDRLNTLLLVAKSEAIMLTSVFLVKHLTHEQRPDASDRLSFPSGHTAQAFLAASIVNLELRDHSRWYGVGAYTVATGVGVLRMVNEKHWQSDIVAGAGFGILSAHLAYLTHRNHWGHPSRLPQGMTFNPMLTPAGGGLVMVWRL